MEVVCIEISVAVITTKCVKQSNEVSIKKKNGNLLLEQEIDMIEVKNTSEFTAEEPVTCAVYGVAGTGKTTFGATFDRPLFLDLNHGLMSVRNDNVRYIDLYRKSYIEITDGLDYAIRDKDSRSIIVDTMGEVCDAVMAHSLLINRRQKAEYSDWETLFNLTKDFIGKLISSGKNVCVICHELTERDELVGKIWCRPMFQGKMKSVFQGYFDELYHSEVETIPGKRPEYKLLARPSSIYTAKSRLLGKEATEIYLKPDFKEIIKLRGRK